MEIKKKNLALVFILILCIAVVTILSSLNVQAKSSMPEPSYNGKWTYYTVNNTIYKLNSETGKTSKVYKVKNCDYDAVSNVIYYKGRLYFQVTYSPSRVTTDPKYLTICSVKTNGKSFKKIFSKCNRLSIYNGRLYFTKYDSDYNGVGLYSAKCSGKSVKRIMKENSNNHLEGYTFANGKLFCVNHRNGIYKITEYSLKNKKKKTIAKSTQDIYGVSSDGNYIYYTANDKVYAYKVSNGKKYHAKVDGSVFGGKNGKIYTSDYYSRNLYQIDLIKNKRKFIKKNVYMYAVVYSKSGYNIYINQLPYEGIAYYTAEIVRMKGNGKGFKSLEKFHEY